MSKVQFNDLLHVKQLNKKEYKTPIFKKGFDL